MDNTIYVLNTDVIEQQLKVTEHFPSQHIVIPSHVLEEINQKMIYQEAVGVNVRAFSHLLRELLERQPRKGSLGEPYTIADGKLSLIFSGRYLHKKDVPTILQIVFGMATDNIINKQIVLVTNNVFILAQLDMLSREIGVSNVEGQFFQNHSLMDNKQSIHSGVHVLTAESELLTKVLNQNDILFQELQSIISDPVYINDFIYLESVYNPEKHIILQVKEKDEQKKVVPLEQTVTFGLVPKNVEQRMCLSLLTDPDIPLVLINGTPETEKELYALAAAFDQVWVQERYQRISFLEADHITQKHWEKSITNRLKYLLSLRKRQKIDVEKELQTLPLYLDVFSNVRVQYLDHHYIILNNVQNLTKEEVEHFLYQVGNHTKIVLMGDIEHINNPNVNAQTSGWSFAMDKLKSSKKVGVLHMKKEEKNDTLLLRKFI